MSPCCSRLDLFGDGDEDEKDEDEDEIEGKFEERDPITGGLNSVMPALGLMSLTCFVPMRLQRKLGLESKCQVLVTSSEFRFIQKFTETDEDEDEDEAEAEQLEKSNTHSHAHLCLPCSSDSAP